MPRVCLLGSYHQLGSPKEEVAYMDDILVCAPTDDVLAYALDLTTSVLVTAGSELQMEKIQRMPPWKYLGLQMTLRTIVPQKLEIRNTVRTLADLQQLSPRTLTPEAGKALEKVQSYMSARQAHRYQPGLPFRFIILGKLPHLHGVIFQWHTSTKDKDQGKRDPVLLIEWVFLSHHRSKRMTLPQELMADLTRKERQRIRELAGCDFSVMTWRDPQTQRWEADFAEVEGSPQVAELAAVQQFYVMHVRSHTDLPGFIAEGNRRADALAAPVLMAPLPDKFEQAKVSHHKFHQNTPGLVRQFQLTRDQAKAIVATCPQCQNHQMPALREKAKDVINHLIHAFFVLGHITGIPHSPTGQAIVERTHQSLKKIIEHQQAVMKVESPHVQLAQALTIRAGNTGAGVCVYCHSYRVKMGSCKMGVPIHRQADTSHNGPAARHQPWIERAPTCQPWFGDTYPNSEFPPWTEFNSF
ncbi:hypothetical protein DV515_00018461 [Chloebia gouldiae]|uniref:Integrase-type domain-containing protein n=1 Tax=Chloebia gouldiae TaxID=44316 RepID=A0A3L8Q7E8_CHLGU|nr:hypothetical protein DV515_00018461 [Chloebia gouldiae]